MTSAEFIDSLEGHNLGWKESMHATYLMARDVIDRGIPGDFVECGVYAGAECAVMARAYIDAAGDAVRQRKVDRWDETRRIHLFDSFQGMPKCGPEDSEFISSGNKPGEACCSMAEVQANMAKWSIPEELLVYHAGWFEDTMELASRHCANPGPDHVCKIALLRLDGDLYESTKTCMKYLYPLVARGGWVIVDDYELSGCRKAVSEVIIPMPCYFQRLT